MEEDSDAEESSKDNPVKLLKKSKIGPPLHNQAAVREADEDCSEDEAEDKGVEIAADKDGLACLDNYAR